MTVTEETTYAEVLEPPSITVTKKAPKLNALGRFIMRACLRLGVVHRLPEFEAAAAGKATYDTTYEGRVLSQLEWLDFGEEFMWVAAQYKRAEHGRLTEEEIEDLTVRATAVYARYLTTIGIPWRAVFDLPPKEFEEQMASFFAYQGAAMPTPTKTTGTTTSTPPTPPEDSSPNGSTARTGEATTEPIGSSR